MSKQVIIVGAVALGPKVACRLRRLDPEADITVIDRDNLISYGDAGFLLCGGISMTWKGFVPPPPMCCGIRHFSGPAKG